jgi:hypothetical protein
MRDVPGQIIDPGVQYFLKELFQPAAMKFLSTAALTMARRLPNFAALPAIILTTSLRLLGPAPHRRLGPLSRNQDPRHPHPSVYSRFCSMAAIPSPLGPQNRSTKPSSPPFSSHPKPTASTSSAMICANSGGTVCSNAMAPAMPTGSLQKAFRSHSCFCSSTSASAAPWPTAAFTTLPTQLTLPTANSSLPITKPTRPSRTSSTYSPLHDVTDSIIEVFLFKIFDPRI